MVDDALKGREILLEMTRIGAYMKVTALDAKSLTEIHLQMPASAGEAACRQAAMQRLVYVMRKKGIVT
jgi:hypothetical protein